jgi:serine phosphatase RsbU (regulator of sigma subunit)
MRVDGRVKYKEATLREGLVSQLTVAMQFRGKAIGVLRLYSPKPRQFYEDDISLARAIASQCSVAITNAKLYVEAINGQRMREQIRLAGVVQRRMIPEKAPSMPGLDIAATYIPCFDVGGDFYDFLQLSNHRVAVAISDVMGKGIPAAIMMSLFRGTVRAYVDADHSQGNIEKIIDRLNKMACGECKDGEFVALFYAVLDIKEKTITYCNCGHEPAVLIRNGKIAELDKGGFVLGIEAHTEYEIETLKLRDGDCLLFYTDGLTDAVNFEGKLWSREKMLETAKKFTADPAEQMVKNILAYRRRFVGLARQVDDTSIIIIKIAEDRRPKTEDRRKKI